MNLRLRVATVVGLSAILSQGVTAVADTTSAALQPAADAGTNVTPYAAAYFHDFRPNTARDMIGRIPGFSFDGGSSGRGFSGTAGNVLIDGQRPPSRGDSLGDVLSRIPATAVERIDIVRAGAGGIDMQGQSVIANVIRKLDSGLSGAVSGGLGLSDTGALSSDAKLQVQTLANGRLLEGAISIDRNLGDGEQSRLRTGPAGGTLVQGEAATEYALTRIEAKGAFEAEVFGGQLRTNALASHRVDGNSYYETLAVPVGVRDYSGDGKRTAGEAGLRYTHEIAGYGIEIVGYQSVASEKSLSAKATPDYVSQGREDVRSGETIARASVKVPADGSLSFEAGAETVYNWVDSSNNRSLDGTPFVLAGDQNRVEELRNEAFGTATWMLVEGLSIEAGARLEQSTITAESTAGNSEKSLEFFKPRVNVSWAPSSGQQWGFRAERVVDQLSFNSFASSASFETGTFGVGNPDIEPAKKWEYEARFERQYDGQTSFVARLVHTSYEDILGRVIVVVPATGTTAEQSYEITRNTGEGSRDRLELSGAAELDDYGLAGGLFSLGVTLRDSDQTDPVTLESRKFSGDQNYSWNVGLSQILYDGKLKWSLYASDNADNQSWQPRSEFAYHGGVYGSGSITWKPDASWTMSGSVNNIFAEDEVRDFTLYDAPRSTGAPYYFERTYTSSARSLRFNIRRNF